MVLAANIAKFVVGGALGLGGSVAIGRTASDADDGTIVTERGHREAQAAVGIGVLATVAAVRAPASWVTLPLGVAVGAIGAFSGVAALHVPDPSRLPA